MNRVLGRYYSEVLDYIEWSIGLIIDCCDRVFVISNLREERYVVFYNLSREGMDGLLCVEVDCKVFGVRN